MTETAAVSDNGSSIDLTGSRVTLVANVAALVVALVILVEVAIIENKHFGYVLASDPFLCFFPTMVMFVVRSEPFSCFFLFLHSLISIRLLFVALDVIAGADRIGKGDNPLFVLVLFEMATIVCLAVYVAVALTRLLFRGFSSAE